MNGQFKVGEVLVGCNFDTVPQFNGMECVLSDGLATRYCFCLARQISVMESTYKVKWADGRETAVRPRNLRRKLPPAGEQSILDMFKLPAPKVGESA